MNSYTSDLTCSVNSPLYDDYTMSNSGLMLLITICNTIVFGFEGLWFVEYHKSQLKQNIPIIYNQMLHQ